MMNDLEALVALSRTFLGLQVMPPLRPHPDGHVHTCTGCDSEHGTIMVDDQGKPYHEGCKRRSMGIE